MRFAKFGSIGPRLHLALVPVVAWEAWVVKAGCPAAAVLPAVAAGSVVVDLGVREVVDSADLAVAWVEFPVAAGWAEWVVECPAAKVVMVAVVP